VWDEEQSEPLIRRASAVNTQYHKQKLAIENGEEPITFQYVSLNSLCITVALA